MTPLPKDDELIELREFLAKASEPQPSVGAGHPATKDEVLAYSDWKHRVASAQSQLAKQVPALLDRITTLQEQVTRMQAVVDAARNMPRETPAPGGCGTYHQFMIAAGTVWANDKALTELDAIRSLSLGKRIG